MSTSKPRGRRRQGAWRWLLSLLILAAAPAAQARVEVAAVVAPARAAPGSQATVTVTLEVQPGWHVYGGLHEFPTELRVQPGAGVELVGGPVVPDGQRHEQHGLVLYSLEGTVTLTQRVRVAADAGPGEVEIAGVVAYQACDESMCDPPAEAPFQVTLTVDAAAAGPPALDLGAPFAVGGDLDTAPRLRIVAARFSPAQVKAAAATVLRIELEVEAGWHVYGSREAEGVPTSLTLSDLAGLEPVGSPRVPAGTEHRTGSIVGHWLEGRFVVEQTFRVPAGSAPGQREVAAEIAYMACTPESCDPPTSTALTAAVEVVPGVATAAEKAVGGDMGGGGTGLGAFLLLAVAAGLFALVMPCTYPMIPITISFFTKQAERRGGGVLPLSLTYGVGIIGMFVVIGLALGAPIVRFATHPVTNLLIAAAFVVFGLSLLGLFDLRPPRFLMDAAGQASQRGGYLGVFLMGATLVVTSFTCTAPFVGSLLSAGQGHSLAEIGAGMGVFGLTMAVPFVVLSLVPGKLRSLPRSGEWMNVLKVFFGFVELAAALKFLSNSDLVWQWQALPRELFLWFWVAIFGVASLYLLGIVRVAGDSAGIGSGRLVSGTLTLMFTVYCLYGAFGNPLDRIMTAIVPNYSTAVVGKAGGAKLAPRHELIKDDHAAAVAKATAQDKLVLINFTGYS